MGKSGDLSPGAGGERPGEADPGQLRQPGPRRVTAAATSQLQQMRDRGSLGGGRKSTPGKRIAAKGPGRRREPPRELPRPRRGRRALPHPGHLPHPPREQQDEYLLISMLWNKDLLQLHVQDTLG